MWRTVATEKNLMIEVASSLQSLMIAGRAENGRSWHGFLADTRVLVGLLTSPGSPKSSAGVTRKAFSVYVCPNTVCLIMDINQRPERELALYITRCLYTSWYTISRRHEWANRSNIYGYLLLVVQGIIIFVVVLISISISVAPVAGI